MGSRVVVALGLCLLALAADGCGGTEVGADGGDDDAALTGDASTTDAVGGPSGSCTAVECPPTGGVAGTGGDEASGGTGTNDPADAASVSQPPLNACVATSPAANWPATTIVTSLQELCSAIGALGVPCPRDRTSFIANVAGNCLEGGRFPSLRRWCDVDEVMFQSNDLAVVLYFDVPTGTLEGVSVTDFGGGLPCSFGPKGYAGGDVRPRYTPCASSSASCSICVQQPDECPPDIAAEIPATPCAAWSPAGSCVCAADGLPETGQSCGSPSDCSDCSSGTCWADCKCMRDGNYRWLAQCTE